MPLIELSGASVSGYTHGLVFQAAGVARGLVINEFSGNGIWVTSSGGKRRSGKGAQTWYAIGQVAWKTDTESFR